MCLAIPMRIKKIEADFAIAETARLQRRVNIQMLPRLEVGDYIVVHAGFAIEKIDPKKAQATLRLINEIH